MSLNCVPPYFVLYMQNGVPASSRRRLEYELQKILTVGWGINYISHHYPLCVWDTMINNFAQNFQDIMSQEKAQKQLFKLQMERGELDEYMLRSSGMFCST